MLEQLRHGLAGVISTISALAISVARIKLLALFLGPVGVGQIGLVTNLIELIANASALGQSSALNRELPRAQNPGAERELASTAILLSFRHHGLALLLGIAAFILVTNAGGADPVSVGLFALAAASTAYTRLLAGFLLGKRMTGAQFIATVVASAVSLLAVWLLLEAGVRNYLIFVLILPFSSLVMTLIVLRRYLAEHLSGKWRISQTARRKLLKIAGPITVAAFIDPLAIYYMRHVTQDRQGEFALGLLQPGIHIYTLGLSLFGSFAGLTIVRWDQSAEKPFSRNQNLVLLAALLLPAVAIPLTFAVGPLWYWFTRLLYSHEFLPAADAIPWFVSGIALAIGSFLLIQTMISRGHNLLPLVVHLCFAAGLFAALESGFDTSLVLVGKAFAMAQAASFSTALLLWIYVQFAAVAKPEPAEES